MDNSKFYGIYTPVISPCDENDKFLLDCFEANIRRLYKAGINGLYVCGGTGDAFRLRAEERKKAAETAVSLSKEFGGNAIIHVGATHQRDSVELAEHAASIGALGISSIPPAGLGQSQTVDYYKTIAKASGLPVLVYHIPAVTFRHPSMEQLVELLDVEGVVGLKMTDWNLFLLRRLLIERPDIVVYNGYDELVCLGMLYGAQGSIGTWQNLFPEMYVKLYNRMKAGETNAAADIQKTFMDFLNIGWKHGIVEVFEALMREMGYAERCFRKPYSELKPGVFESILPQLREKMDAIVAKVAEVG